MKIVDIPRCLYWRVHFVTRPGLSEVVDYESGLMGSCAHSRSAGSNPTKGAIPKPNAILMEFGRLIKDMIDSVVGNTIIHSRLSSVVA